ncbi:MAG: hypothetical protein NC218_03305 [Acetobacter sp.]|nr:hypothetical protein [Acetobacter sp.]
MEKKQFGPIDVEKYKTNARTLVQLHLKPYRLAQVDEMAERLGIPRTKVIMAILDAYFDEQSTQE